MMTRVEHAYTQARLQAQHGNRPEQELWQHLQAYKELSGYLQYARQTSLRPWVQGLHATQDRDVVESVLIRQLQQHISDVASWQPHTWQRAIAWLKHLPMLPALQHLLSGNTAPAWMVSDDDLKRFTVSNQEQRLLLLQQSEHFPMVEAWQNGKPLVDGWLKYWKKLWPNKSGFDSKPLQELINVVHKHLVVFRNSPIDQTWQAREALVRKLSVLFRKHAFHPAASCIHLLLIALDVERLRADIMGRMLFAEKTGNA
jgi:hypothetical protein